MTHQLNIAALPLVICGPILRRVTDRSISVFVATKHPRTLTLRIYASVAAGAALLFEGATETVALGSFLHVAVVTARTTGTPLTTGQVYGYDITFERAVGPLTASDPSSTDNQPASATFADLGLLSGPMPLGYDDGARPGFALPPDNIAQVNLLHGSCRKPHGYGPDMLTLVDQLLTQDRSALTRPHQLFLTGDQIYADDVDLSLLHTLRSNARTLLARPTVEEVPTPSGAVGFDDPKVKPFTGRRLFMRDEVVPFTSAHKDNHLIFLAEFMLMYLMAWSDELWPREPVGSPNAGALTLPLVKDIIPNDEVDLDAEASRLHVITYANGLAAVRRAMANIPCYMIFDDHEITDDWNLNQKWEDESQGEATSARMLRNGLLAYAIFQDWGNQPEQYEAGASGATLLQKASVDLSQPARQSALDTTPNDLDALLSIGTTGPPGAVPMHWHYVIEAKAHRIIVLDTRTRRQWASTPEGSSGLLTSAARRDQLEVHTSTGPKVTLVVSPAPVIGVPLMEEGVQKIAASLKGPAAADSEAWVGNRANFEAFLRSLSAFQKVVLLSGDVHYAFTNQVAYFRDDAVLSPARIVQLCASSLKNEDKLTRLLSDIGHQFDTIGWLGFEGDMTHHVVADLRTEMLTGIDATPLVQLQGPLQRLLADDELAAIFFDLVIADRFSDPAVIPSGGWKGANSFAIVKALADTALGTQWRYLTSFARDTRPGPDRVVDASAFPLTAAIPAPSVNARAHMEDAYRDMVGVANLGQLRFTDAGSKILHRLYWQGRTPLNARTTALMTTEHQASFSAPDRATERPEVTQ